MGRTVGDAMRKYAIFPAEEFDRWTAWLNQKEGGDVRYQPPPEIDDGIVIRRQDMFAPPALDAYANGITIAVEVLKGTGTYPRSLMDTADFFHEQAVLAWDADRKLPD